MNSKYLSNMLIIILFFCSVLDAQCRRGETLRISNGIETKEVDCREATRLIYNEDYWPYSIEDEREDRCPQLASSAQQYYSTSDTKGRISMVFGAKILAYCPFHSRPR